MLELFSHSWQAIFEAFNRESNDVNKIKFVANQTDLQEENPTDPKPDKWIDNYQAPIRPFGPILESNVSLSLASQRRHLFPEKINEKNKEITAIRIARKRNENATAKINTVFERPKRWNLREKPNAEDWNYLGFSELLFPEEKLIVSDGKVRTYRCFHENGRWKCEYIGKCYAIFLQSTGHLESQVSHETANFEERMDRANSVESNRFMLEADQEIRTRNEHQHKLFQVGQTDSEESQFYPSLTTRAKRIISSPECFPPHKVSKIENKISDCKDFNKRLQSNPAEAIAPWTKEDLDRHTERSSFPWVANDEICQDQYHLVQDFPKRDVNMYNLLSKFEE